MPPVRPQRQPLASQLRAEGGALSMQKWLDGLEEEPFSQGDFEAGIGLPITPFMDRSLPGISSKQASAGLSLGTNKIYIRTFVGLPAGLGLPIMPLMDCPLPAISS